MWWLSAVADTTRSNAYVGHPVDIPTVGSLKRQHSVVSTCTVMFLTEFNDAEWVHDREPERSRVTNWSMITLRGINMAVVNGNNGKS